MKLCKRILALLLLLLVLPMPASAAGDIDLSRDTMLTVYALYGSTPLVGMKVEVYRVASVDSRGALTVLAPFQEYAGALDIRGENDAAWQQMAQTLEHVVTFRELPADESITTNEKGIAAFGTLSRGLYLVRADAVELGNFVYATAPFFVMLPRENAATNSWQYQVEARAKVSENDRHVDVSVSKNWKDSCVPAHEHPKITVYLWRGATLWDTVTLPQNGSWSYTWEGLEARCSWYVTEKPVEGYTQVDPVGVDGFDFTITNVCDKKPTQSGKPGKLPQTGQLWWPVPVLLCAGLLCLVVGLVRRRRDEA